MKCPDNEQLMLYVDGELSHNEIADIKAHLCNCQKCQHEVELFKSDLESEALLRDKINLSFQKYSCKDKIMSAVLAEPKKVANKTSFNWTNFILKFMVPALALAIAMFIIFTGSKSEIPIKYSGNLYKVSVFTNNSESFVDSEPVKEGYSFELNADSFKKLDGNFCINIVTLNQPYTLEVIGKTDLSFDIASMTPVFDNCKAKVSLLNGYEVNTRINGKLFNISKKKPFVSEVSKENVSKVRKEEKTQNEFKHNEDINENVIIATTSTIVVKEVNIEEKEQEDSDIDTQEINNEEESLTQNQSSDISIIEINPSKRSEKFVTPFSRKKVNDE